MASRLGELVTEGRNPDTTHLDTLSSLQIVQAMSREDAKVAEAVGAAAPQIAKAINLVVQAMEAGGRLVYMGCGTSGRLGVLDASECPVTFGIPPDRVLCLIAGGREAVWRSMESVEDDPSQPLKDMASVDFGPGDVLVGIAASGRTPYVLGGVAEARRLGAKTLGVSCNPASELSGAVDVSIDIVVGPEVLTGSTRLKAGTATKMVLNALSTGAMVRLGRVYENLMVDFNAAACEKLKDRAKRVLHEITGADEAAASKALAECGWETKVAAVMLAKGVGPDEARSKLDGCKGLLREALM